MKSPLGTALPVAMGMAATLTLVLLAPLVRGQEAAKGESPVQVFIFAGQSNMVGADSKVEDIRHFPPFVDLEKPQPGVRFAYSMGRERQHESKGWTSLQPVSGMVGPELSFARHLSPHLDAPLAIIKCAVGGTHLGGDWNPDAPSRFEMYPRALALVRDSLQALEEEGLDYELAGFVWHQGENDMFEQDYMPNYGKNLKRFLECWRRDLEKPDLPFFIGELCTKTIWGMDLRPRMAAIARGQRAVTESDPLAFYVPTSHIGVEIGNPVGLHYHYGTLGQLQHGLNHAEAYLSYLGKPVSHARPPLKWSYAQGAKVHVFVLAGHRNMEGERAFVANLPQRDRHLLDHRSDIIYRYSLGGGYRESADWEPFGPVSYYDTFGPELSFATLIEEHVDNPIAIVKFTHSGSQINDWTPQGSEQAPERHLYPDFIRFIQSAIDAIEERGLIADLSGIFYHVGENEMSMPPYREKAASWLASTIEQSRIDLSREDLKWYVSQQPPTDHKDVNQTDVVAEIAALAAADLHTEHVQVFDLPPQEKRLVIDTPGILHLGKRLAEAYLGKNP